MRKSTKQKIRAAGLIAAIWLVLGTLAYGALFLPDMHRLLSDNLHGTEPTNKPDVVLVTIDQRSLQPQSEGGLGRWQDWQRAYYAKVIENLQKAGAKVIGIDIFFSEPTAEARQALLTSFLKKLPEAPAQAKAIADAVAASDDAALHDAILADTDVILAANVGGNEVLLPTASIAGTGTKLASVTLQEDRDNVLRRVPLMTKNAIVPLSFPFALFLSWTGTTEDDFIQEGDRMIYKGPALRNASGSKMPQWNFPVDDLGRITVNFQGKPLKSFPSISFVDAYNNTFDPAAVRGKAVLIGETDSGLHDDLYTPMSLGLKRPGVEVHAHALQSLIDNSTVENIPLWMHALMLLLELVILVTIGIFEGPLWGLLALIVLSLGTYGLSFPAFDQLRLIMSTWYIGLSLLGGYACVLIYKIFLEQHEKKQAIRAFSHYVSDKVAQMMVRDPSLLKLGGEKKVLTVTFTDIAGFTTLSERLTPEQISDFLHIYLDTMTQIVLKEDGTLDKYIGDAIMSIYGAPLSFADHAKRACRATLAMHAAIPDVIRRLPLALPEDCPLAIRTGIATGDMVVGNFGSQKRFDYTVIGDTVNLSSRLEGANKQYNSQICVNEATFEAAKDAFLFRTLDIIRVKGKTQPVRIYELLANREHIDRALEAMSEDFERAFLLYQQGNFAEAKERFKDIQNTFKDPVAEMYTHRCAHFIEEPPIGSWDGVYTMKTK